MSRVAAKLAVRPSRRPKSSSTTRRPTCVETNRSVVEWKVPTFSARECRSAADDALGANGSCTCTKSSSTCSSSSSSVRDTSSGSDTDPPRRNGSDCPTATIDAQPGSAHTASGSDPSRSTVARPSRTSSRESDGATTTTRCPRAQSSSESLSTNRLTSWCCSQGHGVTCAIENTHRRIRAGGSRSRTPADAWPVSIAAIVADFPTVRVAAIQATPVILDLEASVAKAERLLAGAAADGVRLAVLPETFLSLYPSNAWAHQASTFGGSDELWERMWESSVEVPGPAVDRLAEAGRVGGLICWENRMPLARWAVYSGGPQIWVAPTADDSDGWIASMRHIAIESGAYVVSAPQFIPREAFPADFPLELPDQDVFGRGGACIAEPAWGELIAGPLYGEEGMVVADCDLRRGLHAKRWFDAVGHYGRTDVLTAPSGEPGSLGAPP